MKNMQPRTSSSKKKVEMSDSCKLLRSLETNHVDECDLTITGNLPEWLIGCLVRNGPGRFESPGSTNKFYNHLLDGQACIHKFKITKTKVIYSSKFIETNNLTKRTSETGSGSSTSVFNRLKHLLSHSKSSDNTNLNILPYANDHLYALGESNFMYRLDPRDLKIIQKVF